jgi:restriction system protein
MKQGLLQISDADAIYNVAGTKVLRYQLEMYHEGLKEHKVLSAPEFSILKTKANLQAQKWDEKWISVSDKNSKNMARVSSIEEAERLTKEISSLNDAIGNILKYTLDKNDAIDWEKLKTHNEYTEKKPIKQKNVEHKALPREPLESDEYYVPVYSFFEKIFKGMKEKKMNEYHEKYILAHKSWEEEEMKVKNINVDVDKENEETKKLWELECQKWEERKTDFYLKQDEYNKNIDLQKKQYEQKELNAILEYCDSVLNNSEYPELFKKDFQIDYIPDSSILIVEYTLPSPDIMPRVKEYKYVASKKEIKEMIIPESTLEKTYDATVYQIILRTIHELFEADTVNAIAAISFNGWVSAINKATGKNETACIVSIQVKKEDFLNIDLSLVDPKACFKNLKGIGSSKLYGITAVQPILQINKQDKRFVEAHNVADRLNGATNIAAMDWEDFEHLIRELFEKEFSSNGGEVKITQASRDGGVDAVAFDPDPIRGGKIVIQAKRYTNTVGVSAVRDLYGTVMNEGATKGILVTTADYGPDAYDFAKNKPLTLMNGANLLYLLEKHGHNAKIDIKEAKKILNE